MYTTVYKTTRLQSGRLGDTHIVDKTTKIKFIMKVDFEAVTLTTYVKIKVL
jgi:hypothetical protein